MEPEISEFSYGYALTEQLIRRLGPLTAAPKFPSLGDEGDLGYDLDLSLPLGASLFLQFKRSEVMKNRSAGEFRMTPPLALALPFYRMKFWPRNKSRQHQLLVDLANAGEEVYYVAPEFARIAELNANYAADSVVERSAWFNPSDIGYLPDDEKHHLAFEAGTSTAWFCSSPTKVVRSKPPFDLVTYQAQKHQAAPTLRDELRRLMDVMIGILIQADISDVAYKEIVLNAGASSSAEPDVVAPYLARMYFNTQLILVAGNPSQQTAPDGVI